jgi:hypothetical protein
MKLLLIPHMGLGDTVVLVGLVRYIAKNMQEIVYPVKKKYIESTECLFDGIDNITILQIEDDRDISPTFGADGSLVEDFVRRGYCLMVLGVHAMNLEQWNSLHPDFSHRFYIQTDVDHSVSYTHFRPRRDPERERWLYDRVVAELGPEYVFLHEDRARGLDIDRSRLPAGVAVFDAHDPLVRSDNILDYCMVMERAKELHFIDSCFALLADRLPGVTCPMTCHAYVRGPVHDSLYAKDVEIIL